MGPVFHSFTLYSKVTTKIQKPFHFLVVHFMFAFMMGIAAMFLPPSTKSLFALEESDPRELYKLSTSHQDQQTLMPGWGLTDGCKEESAVVTIQPSLDS